MEKIKVLFVNHELVCGGAEQALFDLVCLMDKSKFDISILVQHDGGVWEQKFRDAGITVLYDYSCRKKTYNPAVKMKNIVKKLKTEQAYKNDGKGLVDICVEKGADIVVSFSVWENEYIGFAENAKSIKYIHGDVSTNSVFRETIMRSGKELLSQFDRIICVSEAAKNSFISMTGIRDSVEMHFNPLNSENVYKLAQEPVDFPEDVPVICAVGRLAEEKGFERLIVIHRRLLDQGINHKLIIVGDGPDREYLRRIIRATDTEETVILAGYQQNPYPYMKNSKFLVCSSFTEGLPVISMEALSLGIPIISAVPSIGEVFGDEICGLITQNDNASLEEGIRTMLTDEAFYTKAKCGAEKRSTFFDGKRMVREIEELFAAVVSQE